MRLSTIKTIFFSYLFLTAISLSINIDLEEIDKSSFKNFTEYANSKFKEKKIRKYINYFSNTDKGRSFYEQAYPRQGMFENIIKKVFDEYDIPEELKYVSMIESGFNYNAESNTGAVGLWQFMPSTGKIFGLRIDEWIDERKDPYKSTLAAAQYFTSLKRKFGTWELVLAGYNSGDLTVKRAIEKYKSKDFWLLSRYTFPKQTKEFVPQILAVIIISKNLSRYGFGDLKLNNSIDIEKVVISPRTRLDYIAELVDLDRALLRKLNPSILKGITPPDGDYLIKVPKGYKEKIYAKFEMNMDNKNLYKYEIRKGDTLSAIALKFSNSIDEIYKLNNLTSSRIYAGDSILVYKKTNRYKEMK